MARGFIRYKSGYKYQLHEAYEATIEINPYTEINTDYINLGTVGNLLIKKGYAWDGPSGPTFDTRNFMRGSLVHDAVYQLMRQQHLPVSFKGAADDELIKMCREDGMSRLRAWWVYKGVDWFAGSAVEPDSAKEVFRAPENGEQ